jgi:hypothetical protein
VPQKLPETRMYPEVTTKSDETMVENYSPCAHDPGRTVKIYDVALAERH